MHPQPASLTAKSEATTLTHGFNYQIVATKNFIDSVTVLNCFPNIFRVALQFFIDVEPYKDIPI